MTVKDSLIRQDTSRLLHLKKAFRTLIELFKYRQKIFLKSVRFNKETEPETESQLRINSRYKQLDTRDEAKQFPGAHDGKPVEDINYKWGCRRDLRTRLGYE